MKIAFIGALNAPHELVCTHWSGLRAAFNRVEHDCRIFCCRSGDHYIQDVIDWKPDIIVYNLIDMAKNDAVRHTFREKTSAKIIFWYGDMRTPETGQIRVDLRGTVDLFLTSNDGYKEFQRQSFGLTPQWLPLAAEPTPAPVFHERVAYDFIFIGGKYVREGFEDRLNLIAELERNHGLKVINGRTDTQRAKIYQLMPAYYGSATFSLDVSHFWDIPKYTSNRFWVIPANWGFALTRRFPDHELLVPETHHVYWSTLEELFSKMEYYRFNENERQEMIRKGWEYAKEHHTYEQRINAMVAML